MRPLHLPPVLLDVLWAHVLRAAPQECVGVVGGHLEDGAAHARTLVPLRNIAADPHRAYLADPGELLRALRAMQAEGHTLVALYHSHPRGPARPSLEDTRLAAYPVPYLIADLSTRQLRAYLLPEGARVPLHFT